MSENDRGQVIQSAAEVYDQFFVPALFEEWAHRVVDAAHVEPGQRILDVATGTGVLARAAAERVGPTGSVIGVDINDGMLAVARRTAPHIEWRKAAAEALPFNADSFDRVVSQFGLMFFEDRGVALREMMRVLRPGGYLAVAVWASLDTSPGYADLATLLDRLFGRQAAESLHAPFNLGDTAVLRSQFAAAGLPDVQLVTMEGTARFPSLESWMYTEIRGWTLAGTIDDGQYQLLVEQAREVLQPYITTHGAVEFSIAAHIVTAQCP